MWPCVSLICLKWSMSKSTSANGEAGLAPRANIESRCSSNVRRLGRPVSDLGGRARRAHDGLDARLQLVLLEGLADVVVGARAQAAHAIDVLGARRQHDHGHAGGLPDAVERLPAVDARHHDVEQHDVGPQLAEHAQALAVGRGRDLEAGLLEAVRDHRPLRSAVVDDQHGDRAHGRTTWARPDEPESVSAARRASHASISVAASIGPARRSPGSGRAPSMRSACS